MINCPVRRHILLPRLDRSHPRSMAVDRPSSLIRVRHTSVKALRCCACFVLDDLRAHIDLEYVSQALAQTATHQQPEVEPTHPYPTSQLPTHSTSLEGTSYAPKRSTSTSANPQTLDLRALLLSRASGPSKAPQRLLISRPTTSAAPASTPPVPPVASVIPEDDEMEDLYGPPLGLPSPYAPPPPLTLTPPPPSPPRQLSPSPFLQLPEESEGPPLLPMLAARDPRILAMLERQERREATRPRRGKCKTEAVHGAGKKRGGFVLVSNWTMAGAAHAEQASWQTSARR
ncbi:hypothetical protein BC827DRAFT_37300 [Russula dissimulans]|jgi:hypothetical protein|nr:hypothetical protein BC827DRAFT_37300 [Russula dissimulans]